MIFISADHFGGIIKLFTFNFLWVGMIIDLFLLITNKYDPRVEGYKGKKKEKQENISLDIQEQPQESITLDIQEQPQEKKNSLIMEYGSEAQIDWANRVAKSFVEDMNDLQQANFDDGKITMQESDLLTDRLTEAVVNQTDANWWLDTRNQSLKKRCYELLEDDEEAKNIVRKMAE